MYFRMSIWYLTMNFSHSGQNVENVTPVHTLLCVICHMNV